MGNVNDGLRGLFLAAVLVGLFLVITIVAVNFTRPGGSEGEDVLIAFLMGFACARALAWFLRPRRVAS